MGPRHVITMHYMGLGAEAKKKNCYTVMIGNHTIYATVTEDPDVVTEWVGGVDSNSVACRVGFEIEFDFKTLRIATVQFSVVSRCLIFQLSSNPNFPPALLDFLADPNIILVGRHVGSKIGLLRTYFPFQPFVQGWDFCGNAAFLIDSKKTELTALGFVETDWDRLPLSLSVRQAHYACLDAFLNLRIWQPLSPTVFTTVMLPYMKTSITPHVGIPGDDKDFYDVIIYGQTIWVTVTTDLNAVRDWIEASYFREVSLEVEFDITTGRVGTIQFYAGHRCLVFRLLDIRGCPAFLEKFLNTHAFAGDNDMLANVEVLRKQFKFKGKVGRMGVDERAELWRKKSILEKLGLGNGKYQWGRPDSHLTDKEVHYAFFRAFLNLYFSMKCVET